MDGMPLYALEKNQMNKVLNAIAYFSDPATGQPLSGGRVYVGLVDQDPQVPANQITVYAIQEDGSQVAIPQPVSLSSGGNPLYNGSPVTLAVSGNHSIKVLNSVGSQMLYTPDVLADSNSSPGSPQDSIAELVALELTVGEIYSTKGYYLPGDGGGANYLVKTAAAYGGVPDGYGDHYDAAGNVAVLQHGNICNVRQFGAKGDGVADDTDALTAVRDYASSSTLVKEVVFPTGIYKYTTSPNWAIQNLKVTFIGVVRLRNAGVGDCVVLDSGTSGSAFNVNFGFDNPPFIEGTSTTGKGMYIRAVHHSKISGNVRGCGSDSFVIDFAVVSEFRCISTINEGAWYSGARPVNGIVLRERNTGEAVTACIFYNPIIEAVSGDGIYLTNGDNNSFISGTSEGNFGRGLFVNSLSSNNKFDKIDFEANSGGDVVDNGPRTQYLGVYSDSTITISGKDVIFDGGMVNSLVDNGEGTSLRNLTYNIAGTGGISGTQDKQTRFTVRNVASGQLLKDKFSGSLIPTTTSCTSGVATTVLTLPSTGNNIYNVYAYIPNAGAATSYTATAIIAQATATSKIMSQVNGSLLTITLSGQNIQVTQSSGGPQSVFAFAQHI